MQHNPSDASNDTPDVLSRTLAVLGATTLHRHNVTPPSSLHAQRCLCGIAAAPRPVRVCLVYAVRFGRSQDPRDPCWLMRQFAKLEDFVTSDGKTDECLRPRANIKPPERH